MSILAQNELQPGSIPMRTGKMPPSSCQVKSLNAKSSGSRPVCQSSYQDRNASFGKPFRLSHRTGFRQRPSNAFEIEICSVHRRVGLLPPGFGQIAGVDGVEADLVDDPDEFRLGIRVVSRNG
ncbi:hypothetical protein [Rhizobium brockwellii]